MCSDIIRRSYSAELKAEAQAGDSWDVLVLRQFTMRRPPGRTSLQNSSASLLHSRAIFTGSVSRFPATACPLANAMATIKERPDQFIRALSPGKDSTKLTT
jgi:hypothetical protein